MSFVITFVYTCNSHCLCWFVSFSRCKLSMFWVDMFVFVIVMWADCDFVFLCLLILFRLVVDLLRACS